MTLARYRQIIVSAVCSIRKFCHSTPQESAPVSLSFTCRCFVLLIAGLLLATAGCTPFPEPESGMGTRGGAKVAPVNSLAQVWKLPLDMASHKDEIRGLFLRDDTLFVYSQRNRVVALSASDGKPK